MDGNWANRNVLVLGMAKSGVAVAKHLRKLGANVTVNDRKPREHAPEANELEQLGIRVVCGSHPEDLVTPELHVLVKNPGIPYHIPLIEKALRLNIPVVTEIEIAYLFTQAPIIGITGTNGKTTTTTLIGQMLRVGGVNQIVAGNIGQPLVEAIANLDKETWVVAELSSFQLKGTVQFRPKVSVLLNISPAHLDYHHTMEDYVNSKTRLFVNQTSDDIAIINADSLKSSFKLQDIHADVWTFSITEQVEVGVDIREEFICFNHIDGMSERIISVSEVALPGRHNLENALAAIAVAKAVGCPTKAIRHVLRQFRGVEHRLEFVRELNGVTYYNDSKATNAQALLCALNAFDNKIVLIAGGLDRGTTFQELVPVFRDKLSGLVVYGQAQDVLYERGKDAEVPVIRRASDLVEAVHLAKDIAQVGEVVLLSPACASWDQFSSFEERGDFFKRAVHKL